MRARSLKTTTMVNRAGAVLTAVLLTTGIAAAQEAEPPTLDREAVATRLDLSTQEREDLAPILERFESVVARRAAFRARALRESHREVMGELMDALSVEQRRELAELLRDQGLAGPPAGTRSGMGPGGGGAAPGRMGPGARGGPGMSRFHRGAGPGTCMGGLRGFRRW